MSGPHDGRDAKAQSVGASKVPEHVQHVQDVQGEALPSERAERAEHACAQSVHGELIHSYTRAEAIADGVLVDVSRQASPAEMRGGFTVPVAVTAALWAAIEAIPGSLTGIADSRGRLHDVLWMASLAVRRQLRASVASVATSQQFAVHMPYAGTRKRVQTLRVEVGPDDEGGPCVTIGFPEDF